MPDTVIYENALDEINRLIKTGAKVVVISGASDWMVDSIFAEIDVNNIQIIGTKEESFLAGMIAREHCYAANKVRILNDYLELEKFDVSAGYSDSSADIPLLSLCNHKKLVNPSARCLSRFKRAFNDDFECLSWT